jgi:hypothetical protein
MDSRPAPIPPPTELEPVEFAGRTALPWDTLAKWAAVACLAASVLVLDIMKLPADHYINLIVIPGLSYLGLHTAAKTLN